MFGKFRKKSIKKMIDKAEKEREKKYQTFLNTKRDEDMSDITSSGQLEERIIGGTCAEYYGYSENHFCDLSDEDLCACLKSYCAVRRGIGPNNQIFRDIIEKYIQEWSFAFKNDSTSTEGERIQHAIRVAYIDLNIEAARRFVAEHLTYQKV